MEYELEGKVVEGNGYGRKLGFPTVNLDIKEEHEKELPPEGVYAGTALLEDKEYRAGIVVGPEEKIEAHLIGYKGDAYEKTVVLKLQRFLRPYQKFETEEALKKQIEKDLSEC